MSKGSMRRPPSPFVSKRELEWRWEKTFGRKEPEIHVMDADGNVIPTDKILLVSQDERGRTIDAAILDLSRDDA